MCVSKVAIRTNSQQTLNNYDDDDDGNGGGTAAALTTTAWWVRATTSHVKISFIKMSVYGKRLSFDSKMFRFLYRTHTKTDSAFECHRRAWWFHWTFIFGSSFVVYDAIYIVCDLMFVHLISIRQNGIQWFRMSRLQWFSSNNHTVTILFVGVNSIALFYSQSTHYTSLLFIRFGETIANRIVYLNISHHFQSLCFSLSLYVYIYIYICTRVCCVVVCFFILSRLSSLNRTNFLRFFRVCEEKQQQWIYNLQKKRTQNVTIYKDNFTQYGL